MAIEVGEVMTQLGPKSLGDALDALTGTMLTAIEATCGRKGTFENKIKLLLEERPTM